MTALDAEFDAYALSEHERILSNIVRYGTVTAVDAANARVQVSSGGVLSDWMPWVVTRAGQDKTWHPPDVGEQVVVLMPTGEIGQGVVLGALYQNRFPAPSNNPDMAMIKFRDGTVFSYDPKQGLATLSIGSTRATLRDGAADLIVKTLTVSGDLKVGGNLNVGKSITAGGSVTAQDDVVAGGISLKNHTHPTPQGPSGPPA